MSKNKYQEPTEKNKIIKEDKKFKENNEKENKENKKPKKIDIEKYPYTINAFCEDFIGLRKKVDKGFSFKTWYKLTKGGSFHDKKITKEWEVLYKIFITKPTK